MKARSHGSARQASQEVPLGHTFRLHAPSAQRVVLPLPNGKGIAV